MKRFLALISIALACGVALADTTGPTYLYKGSSTLKIPTMAATSLDACQQYAEPLPIVGLSCRNNTVRQITPKHADDAQVANCPSGFIGRWTQTRSYSIVSGAWKAGDWIPTEPPTGNCTPIPPKPADQTQQAACPAGYTGTFPQTKTTTTYNAATSAWDWAEWVPASAPLALCTVVAAPPATSLMPTLDDAKIPAPGASFATARVQPTGIAFDATPGRVEGDFREGCTFSHINRDDPIVFPGVKGASHPHTFVGNTGANAFSTADSIANSGNSTCAGGILNRTSYWFPTMIDTTDNSPVIPSGFLVYYKTGYGGVKSQDIQPVPTGLRLFSGDPKATTELRDNKGRYVCVGGVNGVGWQKSIPTNCYQDNSLIMEVGFPQCWDGVNLDSPDHKRHMAEATGSGCPATHPVALPAISYEIYYDLAKVTLSRMKNWRLSSDNYALTLPAGYSAHGDYFMGWDVPTMKKLTKNCINANVDCHANLLGDGTTLY